MTDRSDDQTPAPTTPSGPPSRAWTTLPFGVGWRRRERVVAGKVGRRTAPRCGRGGRGADAGRQGGPTASARCTCAAGALIGVLTALLGFAIAVQVRSNSSSDSLSNARRTT